MAKAKEPTDISVGAAQSKSLDQVFISILEAVIGQLERRSITAGERSQRPSSLALKVSLDGVGQAEAQIGNLANPSAKALDRETLSGIVPLDLPTPQSDRIQKAKDLLAAGDTYSQGCSGFVCAVLGMPWEAANALMGDAPILAGDNNSYTGLTPGDIAGWTSDSGSGHVTVYIGDPGTKFIDVRSENESPRAVGNGYGNGRPVYKSSRF